MSLPEEPNPTLAAERVATDPLPLTRPKILLVDDDRDDVFLVRRSLERKNCEVVSTTLVTEALKQIATQRFDVLITDLHMPEAGDGFTLVTAMRHLQPEALTLVVSGFPDAQKAMAAILLQADEVLVKPFDVEQLPKLINKRRLTSKPSPTPDKENVASILDRDLAITIQRWLSRVEEMGELNSLSLTVQQRTEYLPEMMRNITARLRADRAIEAVENPSPAAVAHGQLRFLQGYTAPLMVQESRVLQVCIFETIERNLATVDFTAVLPDIMIIADEVDSQLKQAIDSFLTMQRGQQPRLGGGTTNNTALYNHPALI
jgi:CheY-like chemotaxis protein